MNLPEKIASIICAAKGSVNWIVSISNTWAGLKINWVFISFYVFPDSQIMIEIPIHWLSYDLRPLAFHE